VISEDQKTETVIDICFRKKRRILEDTASILQRLDLEEQRASYHYRLLAMYFIRFPGDEAPRLMMPFYLLIVIMVGVSMILMIHNSFAVSMNNRIYQMGILSSVGATPKQIRVCLMEEVGILAFIPLLLGLLSGVILSFGALWGMGRIAVHIAGTREIRFSYSLAVLAVTLFLSAFTVLFSGWIPARKLSKITPLEIIRGSGEFELKKRRGIPVKKHSPVLAFFFGMEGELAGNAIRAQRKAFRTTWLSLTLSFLGFMMMQCFFTLSDISTNHTYFERYQNVWDVMVTIKGVSIEEFGKIRQVQEAIGALDTIIYQKAEAISLIPAQDMNRETLAFIHQETAEGILPVKTSLVILDDNGFIQYCKQIGIKPGLEGGIVINRIWDSKNSSFRYRSYIPYVRENREVIALQNREQKREPVEIPVLAYTQTLPVLREEYEDYELVQVLPLALWKKLAGQVGGSQKNTYVRILTGEETSLEELEELEEGVLQAIGNGYETESENRIQERMTNDEMIKGYKLVLGGFCVFLALIGIANVFSNTLGFLRQREREFTRYRSVGLTPGGMKKIFCIEAMVVVAGPLAAALPLTGGMVWVMIKASYLDVMEFAMAAPVGPILAFVFGVFGSVALAYYVGGRRLLEGQYKNT